MTSFDTFLLALSQATDRDGVLGEEELQYPPKDDVDYEATPQNAVVFGWMCIDGVHYAILKIDGVIRDESPVIQIGPMDFEEPYSLLAPTFTDYLAIGCDADRNAIENLLADEASGTTSLLDFMRARFDQSRFWSENVDRNIGPYLKMITPKPDGEQSAATGIVP